MRPNLIPALSKAWMFVFRYFCILPQSLRVRLVDTLVKVFGTGLARDMFRGVATSM